jgi:hypothetical protein
MDKLRNYIESHRHEFDEFEPSEGHLDRFRAKLMAKKPARRVNLYLVASAAAVAGIIVTASLSLLLNFDKMINLGKRDLAANNLSQEIIQIDEYYRYRVYQKQQMITDMMSDQMSPMDEEISTTLAEFEKSYKNLRQDISESPRPDRAAYVLTLYYQTQLEVMEQFITRLKDINMLNQ